MFLTSWLHAIASRHSWTTRRRPTVRRGLRRSRNRAEQFEDRTLLSTITVTSLDDNTAANGQVTLREALQAANSDTTVDGVTGSGVDTILFASSLTSGGPATLRLSGTELQITSDVTVTGPRASLLTINGDSKSAGRATVRNSVCE